MQAFTVSKVQRFKVPFSFPDCIWNAYHLRENVIFVRPNPKFGAKLAMLGKMSIFNEDFGSSMPSLSLSLNVEP